MNLKKDVEQPLVEFLKPYLSTLHDYILTSGNNVLEINCKKYNEDSSYFILLRMGINLNNKEIYIYNIFLPLQDRKKGIGLRLIAFLYEITKAFGFALVLADMTEGFKEAMQKRGAIATNFEDCLLVTETTLLN